ncbi:unnamed protein product [Thelazia callipaeda]|uniref:Peptidase S1 domain-containing protein n=1 Tax=Thelazia callipaeda TaxID=103827 RepID=A0A0N5D434_THECL|nr:unnamed protein product [Thelazia callipaeda]
MGGSNVAPGEIPWAVAIFRDRSYYCTGTLISTKHLVTAAHCFATGLIRRPCDTSFGIYQKEAIERYTVLYGSNCIYQNSEYLCEDAPDMKMMQIVRAQYGRFFHGKCKTADFALLELEDTIEDDPMVNYICLPHRNIINKIKQTHLIGYGWGNTRDVYGQKTMNNLQMIEFASLLNPIECSNSYNDMPEDVICTEETKTKSTCQGDSGGGLAVSAPNGQWSLLGVLSFGSECKRLQRGIPPNVQAYTDLSLYSMDIDMFTGYHDIIKSFHSLYIYTGNLSQQ